MDLIFFSFFCRKMHFLCYLFLPMVFADQLVFFEDKGQTWNIEECSEPGIISCKKVSTYRVIFLYAPRECSNISRTSEPNWMKFKPMIHKVGNGVISKFHWKRCKNVNIINNWIFFKVIIFAKKSQNLEIW